MKSLGVWAATGVFLAATPWATGCVIKGAPTPRSLTDGPAEAKGVADGVAIVKRLPNEPEVVGVPERGSGIDAVHGTVGVDAPLERVREVVFGFARYPEFMPGYKGAKIVGPAPSGGDLVRMDIEELGGLVKLWTIVDVAPLAREGGVEWRLGTFVSGNIKSFRTRWELEAIGPNRTRLSVQSLVDPNIALVPNSIVNDSSKDGLRKSMLALKARAEGVSAK